MTVAVVVKGYPRLSETFVAQEILGLERRGIDLRIVSLRHPTDTARHAIHDEIAAPVSYLPEYLHREPRRVAIAMRRARRLPGSRAAWRAFTADLWRDRTPNRIRRFGQACVMAVETPPDVDRIHAHFLHTPASVARYAALMLGLPYSLSGHAKDVWTTPDWELAEKLDGANWTVTCCAAAARKLRALAPGTPTELLYHGLDLDRFPPFARRPSMRDGSAADDPVRIFAVGRAVTKKGLDRLIEALAMLPPEAAWRLTHIGAGPDLRSLQRLAAARGVAHRIDWMGAQPQGGVLASLRAADLFALAPRILTSGDRDGLPNVLMEAQSQGLAVVATDVSGVPELVVNRETGLLVPPDDAPALAAALLTLIRDPARRNAMGKAGEKRMHAMFDASVWLDRLVARFQSPRIPGDTAKAA